MNTTTTTNTNSARVERPSNNQAMLLGALTGLAFLAAVIAVVELFVRYGLE